MTASIVIAGGGPAGLAAATEAARAGAQVTVCEERVETGGQLRYRAQPVAAIADGPAERPGDLADRLRDEALAAGVTIKTATLVAATFARNELLITEARVERRLTPEGLIVATGSTDMPFPFAGATLPGVFSDRGLRILLNQHRVRPGGRFAIIGNGTDAEELAVDIMLGGGEVAWSGLVPAPSLRAEGDGGVGALVVGQERYEVDVIAIAVGRRADPALAVMAGVPLGFSDDLGGHVPLVDDHMRSLVPGLFVAGDAAGVGSVDVAIAEGRLAGIAAAHSIGLTSDGDAAAIRDLGGVELGWRVALRASLQPVAVQPYE